MCGDRCLKHGVETIILRISAQGTHFKFGGAYRQDKTRQDNFITFAYTLMTDLAPQVAKLIEAGQEQ